MLPHKLLLRKPPPAPSAPGRGFDAAATPAWPSNRRRLRNDDDPSDLTKFNPVTSDYPAGTGYGAILESVKAAARTPLTPGLANIYDSKTWDTSGTLVPKPKTIPGRLTGAPMRPPMPNNGSIMWSDILRPLLPKDPVTQGLASMATVPLPISARDVGQGIRDWSKSLRWPSFLNGQPGMGAALGAGLGAAALTGASALHNTINDDVQYNTSVMPYFGAGLGALLGYNRARFSS